MYAICNTNNNDVKNCVEEMVRQIASDEPGSMTTALPIVQFGSKVYKRLDETRDLLVDVNKKRKEVSRAINMKTLTIHKHACPHRGLRVNNMVGARLINIPKTGLKVCGHCG